ncbi:hypothetical protein BS50DRAFT_487346 [Corynespora cassiicola Philippines]|uniref:FHA domain-containing protein n=1 Tax=Corynespora cassiicola Philippines TaxID=1448308 RepID=A0A2T2P186_CORCC|nr:hypothetical protein BS50DRAFT_487346 [Corynespora cassiicola Philippines]
MEPSPRSQASQLPADAGHQQPDDDARKPSLLPAFEPLSSSPFPRPRSAKRKFADEDSPSFPKQQLKYYPTPVPTSSTGILTSSSPQRDRPGLGRTVSTLSERVPLGAVPTVTLSADGDILRMGRSSNSSDYQLSSSRLISRVHVQAAYHAPTASYPQGFIEVECLGWNGAKIHCRGRVFDLAKGDTYMSEDPDAEILLDVQETRVMIAWPAAPAVVSRMSWGSSDDDEATPTRRTAGDVLASSPPIAPRSPASQSPIRQPVFAPMGTAAAPATESSAVQVFEDADAHDDQVSINSPTPEEKTFIRPSVSRSGSGRNSYNAKASLLASFGSDDFSDADEENDPVVHSFGPFGDNILGRMDSFSANTPSQSVQRRRSALNSQSPKKHSFDSLRFKNSPIKNHVINQLAFSRIHSQPLSAIHGNLPSELKACQVDSDDKPGRRSSTPIVSLSKSDLKRILDEIPCVGEIPRSGKDAAGKPLENEFYYVPEMDTDMLRRETVTGGMRGTGLRQVRKSHKQYYWKRPRA